MYGSVISSVSSSSGVMVMPFQMQSMCLLSSSITLASQLISTNSGSTPSFPQTARANSVSKPVNSPSSPV